jgi:hypothetical protein
LRFSYATGEIDAIRKTGVEMKSSRIFCAFVLCGVVGSTLAQDMLPLERPVLTIGDTWKYRVQDGWNGAERQQYDNTVVAFEGDTVVLRGTSTTNANGFTLRVNLDQQICRSLRNDSAIVCDGALKFPLGPKYEHKIEKHPWPNGNGTTSGECVGKGMEKVRVPAGEFDAFRVDCKGFWTRIFGGTGYGRNEDSTWYAPSVKRLVKYSYTDYTAQGNANDKFVHELLEYKLAPLDLGK